MDKIFSFRNKITELFTKVEATILCFLLIEMFKMIMQVLIKLHIICKIFAVILITAIMFFFEYSSIVVSLPNN